MNAANFFYYSAGAFAIIGTILIIAISIQAFFAIRQLRQILSKLRSIKNETWVAKEKAKLGLLELISYFLEKVRRSSDSGR